MFCNKCGKKIQKNKLYCPFCGNKINDFHSKNIKNEMQSIPKRKSKKWVFLIIFFIFLLFVGIVLTFLFRDDEDMIFEQEAVIDNLDAVEHTTREEIILEEEIEDRESREEKNTEATTEITTQATTEVEIQEPITYLYSNTPREAFESYVYTLIGAINTGNYSYAETVMIQGSPIYNLQKDLVERLYKKGIKEEVDSISIKYVDTISDTQAWVISDENISVKYSDGTSKLVHQSYRYLCELTADGWLLTEIKDV